MKVTLLFLAVGTCIGLSAPAGAVRISHVFHEPRVLPKPAEGSVSVHFQLSDPAHVTLSIFDGRNLRVRMIDSGETLSDGKHALVWDSRDSLGRPVPPEAYTYVIAARSPSGATVEWGAEAGSTSKTHRLSGVKWDAEAGVVHYQLREPSRVRIRVGLKHDGPLLATLIDWVPRPAGYHAQSWDGKDASGLLELASHPALALQVEAFKLPRNTLLIGEAPDRVALIPDLPEPLVHRTPSATPRRRMFDYANQPIETRRDYAARLELPADLARTKEGLPIVTGPVPVRISVEDSAFALAMNERCEAVFYVDGRMTFENTVSFLPMTWKWDPGNTPGVHYLTANLRGYEGHFGIQTLQVFVEPAKEK